MNRDPETPQKKFFATSEKNLKEFHADCIAVADSGSELFLLLGDPSAQGLQPFIIARIVKTDTEPGMEEYHESFDATWRCAALFHFKTFLESRAGGYSSIGFLETAANKANKNYFPSTLFG